MFKACPRCREAVHLNDFKAHTDRLICLAAKVANVAGRCHLCHQDIPPGEKGWHKHLLVDGCPNNERTVE